MVGGDASLMLEMIEHALDMVALLDVLSGDESERVAGILPRLNRAALFFERGIFAVDQFDLGIVPALAGFGESDVRIAPEGDLLFPVDSVLEPPQFPARWLHMPDC